MYVYIHINISSHSLVEKLSYFVVVSFYQQLANSKLETYINMSFFASKDIIR